MISESINNFLLFAMLGAFVVQLGGIYILATKIYFVLRSIDRKLDK